MKQKMRLKTVFGGVLLALFAAMNVLLLVCDVQAIGPQGSSVGFATANGWFHGLTGVQEHCYQLSDVLGYAALLFVPIFACIGIKQWIKRKSLFQVDADILLLGGFYIVVGLLYAVYTVVAINYRPILQDGVLEPSFPSSHTMLSACVMPTAMMQIRRRVPFRTVRRPLLAICTVMLIAIIVGRILSGYHWLTDIIGGLLISGALVLFYAGGLDLIYLHRDNRVLH